MSRNQTVNSTAAGSARAEEEVAHEADRGEGKAGDPTDHVRGSFLWDVPQQAVAEVRRHPRAAASHLPDIRMSGTRSRWFFLRLVNGGEPVNADFLASRHGIYFDAATAELPERPRVAKHDDARGIGPGYGVCCGDHYPALRDPGSDQGQTFGQTRVRAATDADRAHA
jgi:hypothetical protein